MTSRSASGIVLCASASTAGSDASSFHAGMKMIVPATRQRLRAWAPPGATAAAWRSKHCLWPRNLPFSGVLLKGDHMKGRVLAGGLAAIALAAAVGATAPARAADKPSDLWQMYDQVLSKSRYIDLTHTI